MPFDFYKSAQSAATSKPLHGSNLVPAPPLSLPPPNAPLSYAKPFETYQQIPYSAPPPPVFVDPRANHQTLQQSLLNETSSHGAAPAPGLQEVIANPPALFPVEKQLRDRLEKIDIEDRVRHLTTPQLFKIVEVVRGLTPATIRALETTTTVPLGDRYKSPPKILLRKEGGEISVSLSFPKSKARWLMPKKQNSDERLKAGKPIRLGLALKLLPHLHEIIVDRRNVENRNESRTAR